MKKLHYETTIAAPAERVANTMLGQETYNQWTKAFNPTSSYEGSWDKGSKIYFVGVNNEGKREGMVSEIAEHIPNKFLSIRHYGVLDGDKEITEGPQVEAWAGGLEDYTFEEQDGVTKLSIDVDTNEDHIDYFNKTWPEALANLKQLSEQ